MLYGVKVEGSYVSQYDDFDVLRVVIFNVRVSTCIRYKNSQSDIVLRYYGESGGCGMVF